MLGPARFTDQRYRLLQTDPTRFLSGSDDGTVRLWSIADDSAVACIDTKANVCSVQFSPTQSNLMAFGSANYRVYLYDLRQVCTEVPALYNSCAWSHTLCPCIRVSLLKITIAVRMH